MVEMRVALNIMVSVFWDLVWFLLRPQLRRLLSASTATNTKVTKDGANIAESSKNLSDRSI